MTIRGDIQGEPGTGYEARGNLGAFECANCVHYDRGLCHQPTMVEKSDLPRQDGFPHVDPGGHCAFNERWGERAPLSRRGARARRPAGRERLTAA